MQGPSVAEEDRPSFKGLGDEHAARHAAWCAKPTDAG